MVDSYDLPSLQILKTNLAHILKMHALNDNLFDLLIRIIDSNRTLGS